MRMQEYYTICPCSWAITVVFFGLSYIAEPGWHYFYLTLALICTGWSIAWTLAPKPKRRSSTPVARKPVNQVAQQHHVSKAVAISGREAKRMRENAKGGVM